MKNSEEKVVYTTCASHCGGTCVLKCYVKEGVLTSTVRATELPSTLLLAEEPDPSLGDVRRRLTAFYELGTALSTVESVEPLLKTVVERLCNSIPGAQRGALLLKEAKDEAELKLKASPLGIEKIDIGGHGGRLNFSDKPDIDPVTIIQLIQNQPKIYKLDGNDKLRVNQELPDAEARIGLLENLLDTLGAKQAA